MEAKRKTSSPTVEVGELLPINTHGGQLFMKPHPWHERHAEVRAAGKWHSVSCGGRHVVTAGTGCLRPG